MNAAFDPITLRKIALQLLILLSLLFGAIAWNRQPEGALVWLTGMLTLPAAWVLLTLTGALPNREKPESRRRVYNSLLGAGMLITGTLIVTVATSLEAVPDDWSTRFGMIASALVLVVIGNGLPKKIEPGCVRTRGQAIQRLLGWTFVLTGLALMVVWLSPLSPATAKWVSAAMYATMLLVGGLGANRMLKRKPAD